MIFQSGQPQNFLFLNFQTYSKIAEISKFYLTPRAGFEPALPKREPGLKPGALDRSAISA